MVVAQGGVEAVGLHIGLVCSTGRCGRQAGRQAREADITHGTHAVDAITAALAIIAAALAIVTTPLLQPTKRLRTRSLTHDVEAVLAAQLVPERVVGVVAAAHCVEVEALHQADVLQGAGGGGEGEGEGGAGSKVEGQGCTVEALVVRHFNLAAT